MNIRETLSVSDRCWTYLRGVRAFISHVAGGVRRVGHAYERRTTMLPASVRTVLFVCKGNICRSPLAAVYFEGLLKKEASSLTVRSAGLETTPGKPAHPNAKLIGIEYGLSLDVHATTHLHAELVNQSDLIVVMEIAQKRRIHSLYPHAKGKVVLLGAFDPNGPLEVADPYSGTTEDFRICLHQIRRCCDNLLSRLNVARESSPEMVAFKVNE
jgi:protein-tyrosine phosphatase